MADEEDDAGFEAIDELKVALRLADPSAKMLSVICATSCQLKLVKKATRADSTLVAFRLTICVTSLAATAFAEPSDPSDSANLYATKLAASPSTIKTAPMKRYKPV